MEKETPPRRVISRDAMAAGCGRWASIALVWGKPKIGVDLNDAASRTGSTDPVSIFPETEQA